MTGPYRATGPNPNDPDIELEPGDPALPDPQPEPAPEVEPEDEEPEEDPEGEE